MVTPTFISNTSSLQKVYSNKNEVLQMYKI